MKRKTYGKASALNTTPRQQQRIKTVLPPSEVWLNTAQAMDYFRVSDRTLLRWRERQQIPCSKMGGTVLYPIHLVNKLLFKKIKPGTLKNS